MSLNHIARCGVEGSGIRTRKIRRTLWNEWPKRVKASYFKIEYSLTGYLSTAGHVKCRGNLGGPTSKAKYFSRPIVN
jgi:hypothetical protein